MIGKGATSSCTVGLFFFVLSQCNAAFYDIAQNQDVQIGVSWGGLDSDTDTLFTGGAKSGSDANPEVGCGLLVTRDNGSHWDLSKPGGGAYANPFTLAFAVASNKNNKSSSVVCAAGLSSAWCAQDTSSRESTVFLRAPILHPNGTSGQFEDVKWEPATGSSGGDGIFQVTGQFGTNENWTNGIAVSTDDATTWTLRSVRGVTVPTFASSTPSAATWYTTANSAPSTDDDSDAAAFSPRPPRRLRRLARFLGAEKWAELWRASGGGPAEEEEEEEKRKEEAGGSRRQEDPPPAPPANYVGEVAKTTDGGETWEILLRNDGGAEGGANFTFDDIHCFDEETCIVAANGGCGPSTQNTCDGSQPQNMGGAVWVTVDGGATWAETLRDDADSSFGFSNLRMVGAREVFAVGGGVTVTRSSGVHLWHTVNVTDASAWRMTLVDEATAQLSMGLDVQPATGEVAINFIQKGALCGVVRGFADDQQPAGGGH